MTAASPLTFSTMEVPAVDDTMEMASPYQGQADDFDIDIDLMEDHPSNIDSEMMGADDYLPTSQPTDYNPDAINDADMVDGVSEGSMVDADETYVEEDHDIDVQDGGEGAYEAEMHEGDQGDGAKTPVPTVHVEAPVETAQETANLDDTSVAAKPVETDQGYSQALESVPHVESSVQEIEQQDESVPLEPSQPEQVQDEEIENIENDLNSEGEHLGEKTNEAAQVDVSDADNALGHTELPAANQENGQAKSVVGENEAEAADHTELEHVHEADDQHHHVSLHPVKVIYQENVISLFPPLEGDSSETFFLHDENVVYDDVGKLFSALREVLQDNVAENEVLIMDIDPLGIQIMEVSQILALLFSLPPTGMLIHSLQDSSYTSKVSLHQVLDLYLKLCHNDGSNEPEALYLTLSTKMTVSAEIANLLAAANGGKGLSELHGWDETNDVVPISEEVADSHETEHTEETYGYQQGQSTHETDDAPSTVQEETVADNEPNDQVPEVHAVQEELLETHGDGHVSDGHEAEAVETVSKSEATAAVSGKDDAREADGLHHEEHLLHGDEEFYDSESHNTESTATVAAPSGVKETEAPNEEEEVSADITNPTSDHHHGELSAGEDFGDEHIHEQGDEIHGSGNGIEEGEFEDDYPAEGNGDEADGTLHDDLDPAHDEEHIAGPDGGLEDDNAAAEISQDQPPSTLEGAPQPVSAHEEQTPEPADDLLGIAEDLMQTPAKNGPSGNLEHATGADEDEFPDDELLTPPPLAGDALDEHQFDDGDYFDLEGSEDGEPRETDLALTETPSHENGSAKRARDVEDEWDEEETTTPDTKKPRSS
ncbi:hypothetical protein N7474_004828 [Penicillium riverlandense]|uniref:uncharacterized protein n=1 Tax=Penicillium riverlandense TaxID=1903569 RepID=UPI00254836CC|nr:uncharacterized protein N7474_004828 [Penicillium riverlandense]KAJ5819237.1 hypothetical protein N7474_004828 [Penicillium riverlandense]